MWGIIWRYHTRKQKHFKILRLLSLYRSKILSFFFVFLLMFPFVDKKISPLWSHSCFFLIPRVERVFFSVSADTYLCLRGLGGYHRVNLSNKSLQCGCWWEYKGHLSSEWFSAEVTKPDLDALDVFFPIKKNTALFEWKAADSCLKPAQRWRVFVHMCAAVVFLPVRALGGLWLMAVS